MIAFQTLFLGLVFGFGTVRVMVNPPVATVDFLLDGTMAGSVGGAPWELVCNFGTAPLPHELVVVGRDAAGKEIARVRQWINLPRQAAEARILVRPGTGGSAGEAWLSWGSLDDARPIRFNVTVDGAPIKVKDPERIQLPTVDLSLPHFIVAEVIFPRGVMTRTEASFGGDIAASSSSELTAIAVVLRPGATLPPIEAMQGWFIKGGKPLHVVAIDEGHSDVAVVFDQDSGGRFTGISRGSRKSPILDYESPIQASAGGNRLFAVWAVPKTVFGHARKEVRGLFPVSLTLDLDVDEMRTLIFRFPFPVAKSNEQSLANAVATAGMSAAALNRRRAVVLFAGEAVPDASTISVAAARAYLESINVPLFIWTPERRISDINLDGWGLPDDVSNDTKLRIAMARIEKALAAQYIVWLAGSHLPASVGIAPGVKEIFLARGVLRQARGAAR